MVRTILKDFKCALCGAESQHSYIVDSSAEGEADLDLRPPEPHRSTMEYWTTTCPQCGYCCEDIQAETSLNADFIKSEKYLTLDGINAESELAKNFIKKALIKLEIGDKNEAMQSYIYASWAFDDSGESENAVECRIRAIELIDELLKCGDNLNYEILRCELLRRAGRFEDVIAIYSKKRYINRALDAVVRFELAKAQENDSSVYKFNDIKVTYTE